MRHVHQAPAHRVDVAGGVEHDIEHVAIGHRAKSLGRAAVGDHDGLETQLVTNERQPGCTRIEESDRHDALNPG